MPVEYLEEYDRYVMIAGIRDIRICDAETALQRLRGSEGGLETQLFDVKGVAGREHLRFAVLNALKAWASGKQLTSSVAVEVLLYASGQRQIKNAIMALGVSPNSRNLAVTSIASDRHVLERLEADLPSIVGGKLDETVLDEGDELAIRRIFGITDNQVRALVTSRVTEREAVIGLVIERMALLSVQT